MAAFPRSSRGIPAARSPAAWRLAARPLRSPHAGRGRSAQSWPQRIEEGARGRAESIPMRARSRWGPCRAGARRCRRWST